MNAYNLRVRLGLICVVAVAVVDRHSVNAFVLPTLPKADDKGTLPKTYTGSAVMAATKDPNGASSSPPSPRRQGV